MRPTEREIALAERAAVLALLRCWRAAYEDHRDPAEAETARYLLDRLRQDIERGVHRAESLESIADEPQVQSVLEGGARDAEDCATRPLAADDILAVARDLDIPMTHAEARAVAEGGAR